MNLWVNVSNSSTGSAISGATFGGPSGLAASGPWPGSPGLYFLQGLESWQSFWANASQFNLAYFNTDANIKPDGTGMMWVTLTPKPCGWPNCPP
jgi:hypothetical protein